MHTTDEVWIGASTDHEAQAHAQRLSAARIAAHDIVASLMRVESKSEHVHRKALFSDRLDTICGSLAEGSEFAVLRSDLEASLDHDFDIMKAAAEGGRSLNEIAYEIANDWGPKVNFAAKPYLEAMFSLDGVNDRYGVESASEIVARFLGNAGAWRGETAKRVKAELKGMLKGTAFGSKTADLAYENDSGWDSYPVEAVLGGGTDWRRHLAYGGREYTLHVYDQGTSTDSGVAIAGRTWEIETDGVTGSTTSVASGSSPSETQAKDDAEQALVALTGQGMQQSMFASKTALTIGEMDGRSYEATCPNESCSAHGVGFVHDDLSGDSESDGEVAECPECETPLVWDGRTASKTAASMSKCPHCDADLGDKGSDVKAGDKCPSCDKSLVNQSHFDVAAAWVEGGPTGFDTSDVGWRPTGAMCKQCGKPVSWSNSEERLFHTEDMGVPDEHRTHEPTIDEDKYKTAAAEESTCETCGETIRKVDGKWIHLLDESPNEAENHSPSPKTAARYGNDPLWITTKYPGQCRKCRASIPAGGRAWYWPSVKINGMECESCGSESEKRFLSEVGDEEGMVYAGAKTAAKTVHQLDPMNSYGQTQTDDSIKDGDVIVVEDGRIAGFLLEAWPVAVTLAKGELHGLSQIPSGYQESFDQAVAYAEEKGWPIDPLAGKSAKVAEWARDLGIKPIVNEHTAAWQRGFDAGRLHAIDQPEAWVNTKQAGQVGDVEQEGFIAGWQYEKAAAYEDLSSLDRDALNVMWNEAKASGDMGKAWAIARIMEDRGEHHALGSKTAADALPQFQKKKPEEGAPPAEGAPEEGEEASAPPEGLDLATAQPGQEVGLHYTLTGEAVGEGDTTATLESFDQATGKAILTYENGRFEVTKGAGGNWVDAAGTQFSFSPQGTPADNAPVPPGNPNDPAAEQKPPAEEEDPAKKKPPFQSSRRTAGDRPPLGSQYEYEFRLGVEDYRQGREYDPVMANSDAYKRGYSLNSQPTDYDAQYDSGNPDLGKPQYQSSRGRRPFVEANIFSDEDDNPFMGDDAPEDVPAAPVDDASSGGNRPLTTKPRQIPTGTAPGAPEAPGMMQPGDVRQGFS